MNADPNILQMKYTDVVALLAKTANVSMDAALKIFYESKVYQLMRNGISDMHCMSEPYLVESILEEVNRSGSAAVNSDQWIVDSNSESTSNVHDAKQVSPLTTNH